MTKIFDFCLEQVLKDVYVASVKTTESIGLKTRCELLNWPTAASLPGKPLQRLPATTGSDVRADNETKCETGQTGQLIAGQCHNSTTIRHVPLVDLHWTCMTWSALNNTAVSGVDIQCVRLNSQPNRNALEEWDGKLQIKERHLSDARCLHLCASQDYASKLLFEPRAQCGMSRSFHSKETCPADT